ncbi:putative zinc finger protein 354b isoform x1 [Lasius niger]|uniref:Putative zinc finger protein 354b isoform x1 n=1 Tax=Lasius niger TaxID=67767 RepID=A0A0J7K1R3_LASNI|nr:putative zinc finger protein 354b isoform x1 [Lasius niger]
MLWEFISEDCDNTDFSNEEECTKESINECYLFFLQNVLPEFSKVILLLESDTCTSLDIDQIMRNLCNQLKSRLADNLFGSKVRCILKNLTEDKKRKFMSQAHTFLQRAIKYLEDRYDFGPYTIYKKFELLSPKSEDLKLTWDQLSEFPALLKIESAIDCDFLYSEFTCLRAVFDALSKDLPNDKIGAHFFRKDTSKDSVNLKKCVSLGSLFLLVTRFAKDYLVHSTACGQRKGIECPSI